MKYFYFADAYGAGTYNTCNYNQGGSVCVAGASGSGAAGGLVNTGVAVAGVVTLACLIVLVSVIVRVWKRRAAVPVVADETAQQRITTRHSNDQ